MRCSQGLLHLPRREEKGYIDILEGRLYELESALLQVLPLVSNEQLNEITASIPPIPSRPHFRARFSRTSDGSSPPHDLVVPSTPPSPSEIVFHQVQQQHRENNRPPQQLSQMIATENDELSPCSLQHNQQYVKQMMSDSWLQHRPQQQHHLPLELSPFVGGALARQDQYLVFPARHGFVSGGPGSELDFMPDYDRNGARETVMVSSRGF
ncbi:uncharacterized protein Z519_02402 [Cladophialophora bantiana CBS 173.52]|uniref:Uncharacterized protein n=1 Tax=Cladophialophora bantiana (strain ATCC 10958 / CBS 173.52 / CDC B-1940 / NIH 8579) TaxID=1442370 RepID=A0A0D2F4A7_CLAB1|nr:uncharacterized protein Z519_02402 [Cladophialophora bantiana CBS 173.52]KIW97011.1 hypothetical protein Z519_02402 [Cladophialophora bantiana CBS 173.52]